MRPAAEWTPPSGALRQVDETQLFVDHQGEGEPAVVFLPGAGLTALDYLHLHERVAATRSSILYDRSGTGFSEHVALPRTSRQVTDELHSLLSATNTHRLVLVGHSLGGLYARHYATRFPDEVAGLVLLDPAHEDYDSYMPVELTAARSSSKIYDIMNVVLSIGLSTAPTRALLTTLTRISPDLLTEFPHL